MKSHIETLKVLRDSSDYESETEALERAIEQLEKKAQLEVACKIFNAGFQRGHNDTVESAFCEIHENDAFEYWADEVGELLQFYLERLPEPPND